VRNGHRKSAQHIELGDHIVIAIEDGRGDGLIRAERDYEVVGIVEDTESTSHFAVAYCHPSDEFIITDESGRLLDDDGLAQEILDDYLARTEKDEDDS
jgi:hypothetical protein